MIAATNAPISAAEICCSDRLAGNAIVSFPCRRLGSVHGSNVFSIKLFLAALTEIGKTAPSEFLHKQLDITADYFSFVFFVSFWFN